MRHKLFYVWPNWSYFKSEMDEPTKAVANYLASKLKYFPQDTEKFLTKKFEQLKAFNEASYKKHHSDTRGWHSIVGKMTPEEELENRNMSLLLLDQNQYSSKD
jgi:hypothetical protein